MSTIVDTHTLYVRTGSATRQQIVDVFKAGMTRVKSLGVEDTRFRVNLATKRDGTSLGVAYVYICSSEAFHLLLGRNRDGSERISYIDDPNWKPRIKSWDECDEHEEKTYKEGMSWADFEEDVVDDECPKIAVKLDPLITLPPYEAATKDSTEAHHLLIDRATARPIDSRFIPNILRANDVPKWVSAHDLKAIFAMYTSDTHTPHTRNVKGKKISETYPIVTLNDGVAFIIFDPQTYDAYFALYMMRKYDMVKVVDRKRYKATMIFGNAHRADKEIIDKRYLPLTKYERH